MPTARQHASRSRAESPGRTRAAAGALDLDFAFAPADSTTAARGACMYGGRVIVGGAAIGVWRL